MRKYNIVIIGAGVIANELANALLEHNIQIYGVYNRTLDKAYDFQKRYNVEKVYENINDVYLDKKIDFVYISTPHNTHYSIIKESLENNINVLAEKSITLNSSELNELIEIAEKRKLILAEAMTVYHMPLFKKLLKLIKDKNLGNVNMITMNFGSYKEYNMENRFFNRNLAGGALLDIGVYAISFVRMMFNSTPNIIESRIKLAPTGVDENAVIILENNEQQMATIALSLHSKQPKRAMISCDKAYIEIMEYPRAVKANICYTETNEKETIEEGVHADSLYYEYLDMIDSIEKKKNNMKLDYTKDVMDIMTSIRKSCEIIYPEEER